MLPFSWAAVIKGSSQLYLFEHIEVRTESVQSHSKCISYIGVATWGTDFLKV